MELPLSWIPDDFFDHSSVPSCWTSDKPVLYHMPSISSRSIQRVPCLRGLQTSPPSRTFTKIQQFFFLGFWCLSRRFIDRHRNHILIQFSTSEFGPKTYLVSDILQHQVRPHPNPGSPRNKIKGKEEPVEAHSNFAIVCLTSLPVQLLNISDRLDRYLKKSI